MIRNVLVDSKELAPLKGRYITLSDIESVLNDLPPVFSLSIAGYSELGRPIYRVDLGLGPKKVFAWSQMHGNESTTTLALLDFFIFIAQNVDTAQVDSFIKYYSLTILPMLNPDGAEAYTRENANDIDLNRDAGNCRQAEMQVWKMLLDTLEPDLCLNLHDQRTIYSLPGGKPATISFLSPAGDEHKTITPSREVAMQLIARMRASLESVIPGQIGRYKDEFNADCAGDRCSMRDIPTILFEAGHFPGDYQRNQTRRLMLDAFLVLFGLKELPELTDLHQYRDIPENSQNFRDLLVRKVRLGEDGAPVDLAIQFTEELNQARDAILFIPRLEEIGFFDDLRGHREIDGRGSHVLINNQESIEKGEKVLSIVDKSSKETLFWFEN